MSVEKIPLIIKANKEMDAMQLAAWNPFEQPTNFIKAIETLAAGAKMEDISKIISGIPTPWARAAIFQYAIESTGDDLSQGLEDFYDKIKTEWKALIACLALYKEKIIIKKIHLTPPKNVDELSELSNFKGRAGAMLFNNIDFWRNPENPADNNANPPYIQLIKLEVDQNKQVLLGGTSPFSLLFTPPQVKIDANYVSDVKFLDERGNWQKPTTVVLEEKELQEIYDCVSYIKDHLGQYRKKLNGDREEVDSFKVGALNDVLEEYQSELKAYEYNGIRYGKRIKSNNLYDAPVDFFQTPFDTVFNAESKLYQKDGVFYKLPGDGRTEVRVKEFLAPSQETIEVIFNEKDGENADRCTSYLLPVPTKQADGRVADRYFVLPLSQVGVLYFQHKLDVLLNTGSEKESDHFIKGELINRGKELKVTLNIKFFTDNENNANETDFTKVEKSFKIQSNAQLRNDKIITWPNFISKTWQNYYLYSNLPHNIKNSEIKAFPLIGSITDTNVDITLDQNKIVYIEHTNPSHEATSVEDVKMIVKHPNASNSDMVYEIYESKFPFVGVEMRIGANNPKVAGYLLTKDTTEAISKDELRIDKLDNTGSLSDATVGIDFGSNNTCISYFTSGGNRTQRTVNLQNRRRFFLGSDKTTNSKVAREHELFFFQKEPTTGELKSMLIAHSRDRLENPDKSVVEEARGGFPMLEKNLPISGIPSRNQENNYEIKIKKTTALIKYNMKWADDDLENDYKLSFLKTLWLQIYAELFVENYKPSELYWAYPAAMGSDRINKYKGIWEEVARAVNPLNIQDTTASKNVKIERLTEGEAVAKYATQIENKKLAGGGLAASDNTLAIGYDVGGSTTDILMMMQLDKEDAEKTKSNTALVQQSSILLAAQALAETAKLSNKIRKTLKDFLEYKKIKLYGISDIDEDTAPFYLNAVFDRLTKDELTEMYSYFQRKDCKEIFAIVSYVTGLILYYTGQLAARVIQKENKEIKYITKGFYGKGGNIFNWITTAMSDTSEEYFKNCFFTGLGRKSSNEEELKALKSELSNLQSKIRSLQTSSIKTVSQTKTTNSTGNNNAELAQERKNNEELKKALLGLQQAQQFAPSSALDAQVNSVKEQIAQSDQKIALLSGGNTIDQAKVAELTKALEGLEMAYKFAPSDALLEQINSLKAQLAVANGGSTSLSAEEIAKEKANNERLVNAINGLKQALQFAPSPALKEQVKNLEAELAISNQKLAGSSSVTNTIATVKTEVVQSPEVLKLINNQEEIERQIKYLEAIENVSITTTTKYEVNLKNNKREVSYGLSSPNHIYQPDKGVPEIIGEVGYKFEDEELPFTNEISTEHLKEFERQFKSPQRFEKLEEFVEIYCEFAQKNDLIDVIPIRQKVKTIPVEHFKPFVEGVPQFREAKERMQSFDFKTPMIILEGMCLLEQVIFKQCFPDSK